MNDSIDENPAPIWNWPVVRSRTSTLTSTNSSELPRAVEIVKAGFVNGQGIALPSSAVTALEGSVSSVEFDYDAKSQLRLTRVDATSTGSAIPTDAAVVIGNPQLTPNKKRVYPAVDADPTLVIDDLFPYTAGYEAWVGDCADADPESEVLINPADPDAGTMRRYSGADRDPAIPVVAGSATLQNVRMASLPIEVRTNMLGLPVAGATVRLTHAPDELCSGGATLT